jgi:DNA invertase Pin-like site-specific DNA recombinase
MTTHLAAFDGRRRSITADGGRPPGASTGSNGAASNGRAPRDIRPARSELRANDPVIGYVSALADANGGTPSASQRAIEVACARAGWRLLDVLHDLETRRTLRRPQLHAALERIMDGEAHGLVVSHARLLGHSIADLAPLLQWFQEAQATLVALDLGLDTSTLKGSRVAKALITLNGWDHTGIVRGARRGTAELRPRGGRTIHAVRREHAALLDRLAEMVDDELGLDEIADRLNAEGLPTITGGDKWWPSTVRTALRYVRRRSATPADELPSLENHMRS